MPSRCGFAIFKPGRNVFLFNDGFSAALAQWEVERPSAHPRRNDDMAKRGKVLRDPLAGPGLLMVEGQQYPFVLDGIWRSAVPASAGLAVDVDFDSQGSIRGITAVPDSQLAKEQAEVALTAAKEK